MFCIKSPELKIVPVADTTAAWAFDVEVAAKQNDDKYVPYQGFASQERVDMTQLLLLGKFEYTGGPIFKVVLEC